MRRNGRVFSAALVSTAAGSALALAALSAGAWPAQAAPAAGAAAAKSGAEPVIIFLKHQFTPTGTSLRSGQRTAQLQAAQAPTLGQLQLLGARDVHTYQLADAIAAQVPSADLRAISASPGVASVIPDGTINGPDPATAAAALAAAAPAKMTTPAGACSSAPQLEPEGLGLTSTVSATKGTQTARSLGYTGSGVKVAFLADGIDPSNANLQRGGKSVISSYQDFSGDGSTAKTLGGEAFLDANAIAGQGSKIYNVAGFSDQVPSTACDVQIEGTAPGASLVALKVFSQSNTSSTSGFLRAIDYAVNVAHVNVLNESFGANPFPDVTSLDAVKEFNDMAVRAGVTVVVASGDAGPFNTIGSPASDPKVIAVGATTDFRFYDQTDYEGADKFAPGGWTSGNISSLSSGGYTEDGRTLDLVAPGDLSFASCTPSATYASCVNFLGKPSPVEESGGTSQAAPLVAGAAALVIQAYAKAHGGARPAPAQVKQILLSSATDLGAPAAEQGSGELNSLKAAELAASTSAHRSAGGTLRLSNSQFNFAGKPGKGESASITVTNTATTTQKVSVAGRGFGAAKTVKKATVTLSDTKSPHFTNWAGTASNDETVTFTVPKGAAVLNTSVAWPATPAESANQNARVRLILVNPSGKLAGDSLPQGVGGYGTAQVLRPKAGTWTAVIFSDTAKTGGTAGKVQFGASVQDTTKFGSVSPSAVTLKPGASAVVHVGAKVPAGAGDSSGAVVFSAAAGAVSVPVTLRGQVVTAPGLTGTFSGELTGGNGRSPGEGQVATYSITVPDHNAVMLRDLDVDVSLANDPANQVSAYLVSPGGETMGYGSSYLTTGFTGDGVPVETPEHTLSVYTSNPIPGNWTLIIDFTSPVPGNELADAFTGRVRLNTLSFSRGALPDSPSVTLKANTDASYKITLHNTGEATEDIFLDPRLTTLATYPLTPQDQVAKVKLPLSAASGPPEWIVPPMTHSVSVTATSSSSSVPVQFDFGPFPGDPDEASTAGVKASATYPVGKAVTPVTPGLWFAAPSETGPFSAAGAKAATVTTSMSAVMQQFDTHAASGTGDFWKFAVQPLASGAQYNLLPVSPGQTKTITFTIKPSGAKGTVVQGMLYIDDFVDSLQFLSGSQLVALPYEYKIG
jgi:Subtilase family